MSKFPNKTASELRQYFNRLNLVQLIEVNRSYGPHFVMMEDKIDHYTEALQTAIEYRNSLIDKKNTHEQNYEEATLDEKQFRVNLNSLSDASRIERFMARQALGFSPMDVYEQQSNDLEGMILNSTLKIENLSDRLETVEQKKKAAISELRILNSIIDEKKKSMIASPMEQCTL